MFRERENLSKKLTSMVTNKVSLKFFFVMFFWELVHFSGPHGRF